MRRKITNRMWFSYNYSKMQAHGTCQPASLADNNLVPPVESIKISERYNTASVFFLKFIDMPKKAHPVSLLDRFSVEQFIAGNSPLTIYL